MGFSGSEEGAFLAGHLGPALARDHPGLRVFIHDDQKAMDGDDPADAAFMLDRVDEILSATAPESNATAAAFASGVAFHWCTLVDTQNSPVACPPYSSKPPRAE